MRQPGAGRLGRAVGGRHDPGRLPGARRARPVHRPGGDDRRIAAGGEVRRSPRPRRTPGRSSSATSSSWAPTSSPARPPRWWSPPASRTYFGTLAARAGHRHRAQRLPGRRQQRELAADPLRGGDGADRAAGQRLHQGQLARGLPVRALGGGGADARDAADDRDLDAGQGRGAAVAQEGRGQAAGRDPELRRDGRAVHRQDRHADAGQDRARAPHRRLRPARPTRC